MRAALTTLCLLLAVTGAVAGEPGTKLTVLTSLQATYSMALALAEGTNIETVSVVTPRVRMARHSAHFGRDSADFPQAATAASAVISIGSIWSADPLYGHARRHNIRVVPIDAAMPMDGDATGVAMLAHRSGTGTLPQVWMSPLNGIRMAEIIAADLRRLSPPDAARVDDNLDRYKRLLFAIKRSGDDCLDRAEVPAVIALSEEFAYLTDAMNIEVVDYFLDPEEQWDNADIVRLRASVENSAAPVVIHKWRPRGAVLAAIEASGAALVVLDTLDPPMASAAGGIDPDGYTQGLEKNLQLLCHALAGRTQ